MARISHVELTYCRMKKECLDCHSIGDVQSAVTFQIRGNLRVPVCRRHFNKSRSKISERNSAKYLRRSGAKQEAGICVQSGCHNKMIPRELLPPQVRQRTCGMPHFDRLPDVKRRALCDFIAEYYLSPEQRREMKAQSIVLAPQSAFALFSLQTPWYYLTKIFVKDDLLKRYKQFLRKNPGLLAKLITTRT